jgi:hypothetical protein
VSYDADKLRTKIAEALDGFIGRNVLPIGRKAIVNGTTETALYLLTIIGGDPDAPRPRGLLTSPEVKKRT